MVQIHSNVIHSLKKKMFIKKFISKYQKKKKKFLLALSGGVDSTVLLYQLLKWKKKNKKITIRAIHINHNLHNKSKKTQKHCKTICKNNHIKIIIHNITIPEKNKYGVEGYARIKRLKIFKKFLLRKEILITGHNLNDQCENLFLSLKRKKSIQGLKGMDFLSRYEGIKIARPLILTKKEKIISWAKKKKISWIEDPTNQSNQYDRNFLRNNILSKIYQRWPYFLKNCTNSMKILSHDYHTLNFFILQFIKKNTFLDGKLSILNFNHLTLQVIYSILKKWLEINSNNSITKNITKRIYEEIILNKNFFNKRIIFSNREIRRFKQEIYYVIPHPNYSKKIIYWKNILKRIDLPNQLGTLLPNKKFIQKKNIKIFDIIPYPKKNVHISIRFYNKQNYINPITKEKINIKKIWQKNNIPPWLRNTIPLLFYNEMLISGIGIFNAKNISQKYIHEKKMIQIKWINSITQ